MVEINFFSFIQILLRMEFEPCVRIQALGKTCEEVSMKDDC